MGLMSVIIPSYNEEANIENTAAVITQVLEAAAIEFEILFISDGSRDGTYQIIQELSKKDKRICGAEFSRNFGKEASIFAGLELAKGDCAVVIDCDLQHPPQIIPQMFKLWKEGYDVIEGIKSSRGKESIFHKMFAGAFYGMMSKLMKMNMNSTSDFKLIDRKVIDVLLELQERNTFFRALTFWVGYKSASVEFEVQERAAGESKWSFWSLMKYAVSNATSFTTIPLQLITVLGVISIVFSIVLAIQTCVKYFMGTSVEGFTTVILLILIIGGFIMLSLGIIGHYLARIYEEAKGRPKYILKRTTDEKQEKVRD